MTPVTQTRTGEDGNCFAAALASILEIPLHVVPEFGGDDVFVANIQRFLAEHGLYYVRVAPDDPALERAFESGDVFHTIEGVSPRGGEHATVGLNGEIVHDPHPQDGTGRGLVSVDAFGLLCARMSRPPGGVNPTGAY
ncbi:MAG TPA: hypothetical protein VJ801_12270 [Polyangia bacterium]|jgi:hypothetical protein|nr:hypothetical protein [Polyangia bacterium]